VAVPATFPRLDPPPGDLDELVEWFERASTALVLLELYPLEDLRRMVGAVSRAVRGHPRAYDDRLGARPPSGADAGTWAMLRADHAWFRESVEQLAWFLRVVENEDHGGHRQALGQYGRLLAEALRRHRVLEEGFLGAPSRTGSGEGAPRLGQR
jgi:hypothetical protein